MSVEQFWFQEPYLLEVYSKAYEIKLKDDAEEYKIKVNFNAWLKGVYIQNAIASVFSKNSKYPQKPFDISGKEERQEIDFTNSEQEIKKRSKIIHQMLNKNQSFTENHKN